MLRYQVLKITNIHSKAFNQVFPYKKESLVPLECDEWTN